MARNQNGDILHKSPVCYPLAKGSLPGCPFETKRWSITGIMDGPLSQTFRETFYSSLAFHCERKKIILELFSTEPTFYVLTAWVI
jgi:hypothetical protein